jgi:hypothetical protein
MFLCEICRVLPGDLLAFVAADRFAKVREDLRRGLIVRRASLWKRIAGEAVLVKPLLCIDR